MAEEIQTQLDGVTRGAVEDDLALWEIGVNVESNRLELITEIVADTTYLHFPSLEKLDDIAAGDSGALLIGVEDDAFTVLNGDGPLQPLLKDLDTFLTPFSGFPDSANIIIKDASVNMEGAWTCEDNVTINKDVAGRTSLRIDNDDDDGLLAVDFYDGADLDVSIEWSNNADDFIIATHRTDGRIIFKTDENVLAMTIHEDQDISVRGDLSFLDDKGILFSVDGSIYSDGTNLNIDKNSAGDIYIDSTSFGSINIDGDNIYIESISDDLWLTVGDVGIALSNNEISVYGNLEFWTANKGIIGGTCYGNDIGWVQASATQNAWYTISDADMTSGVLNGVTHDGNGELTVINAGVYLADWAGSFMADAAGKHVECTFSVNGTPIDNGQNHIETNAVSKDGSMSGCTYLDLPASATVKVVLRTTDTGTPDLGCEHLMIRLALFMGT